MENFFDFEEILQSLDNYLLLEIRDTFSNKLEQMVLLNLKTKQKIFKIGSSERSDVVLDDEFVSKINTYLKIEEDKILVHDNFSHFGTLVKVTNKFSISDLVDGYLVLGKSSIGFHLFKPN